MKTARLDRYLRYFEKKDSRQGRHVLLKVRLTALVHSICIYIREFTVSIAKNRFFSTEKKLPKHSFVSIRPDQLKHLWSKEAYKSS
jgi:hypothetical protein